MNNYNHDDDKMRPKRQESISLEWDGWENAFDIL